MSVLAKRRHAHNTDCSSSNVDQLSASWGRTRTTTAIPPCDPIVPFEISHAKSRAVKEATASLLSDGSGGGANAQHSTRNSLTPISRPCCARVDVANSSGEEEKGKGKGQDGGRDDPRGTLLSLASGVARLFRARLRNVGWLVGTP